MKGALIGPLLLALGAAAPNLPAAAIVRDPPPLAAYAVSVGQPPNWSAAPEDPETIAGSGEAARPTAIGARPVWRPPSADFAPAWLAEQAFLLPPA